MSFGSCSACGGSGGTRPGEVNCSSYAGYQLSADPAHEHGLVLHLRSAVRVDPERAE